MRDDMSYKRRTGHYIYRETEGGTPHSTSKLCASWWRVPSEGYRLRTCRHCSIGADSDMDTIEYNGVENMRLEASGEQSPQLDMVRRFRPTRFGPTQARPDVSRMQSRVTRAWPPERLG